MGHSTALSTAPTADPAKELNVGEDDPAILAKLRISV
jgi:hypothetical protein